MDTTIEKDSETAHVRLFIPKTNHKRAKHMSRVLSVKKDKDVTIANVYLRAIEIGLKQLERTNS